MPADLTRFVGHAADVDGLVALLRHARLVTLIGPGGVGKTRLALHVAAAAQASFRDGVVFVDLSAAAETRLVVASIAAAVRPGYGAAGTETLADLVQLLHERSLLLVLDTFEHLVATRTGVVAELLGGAPDVTILVTSREPLRLPGERRWPVQPLPVPDPSAGYETIASSEAVQLLVERVAALQPGFTLTHDNGSMIAELARRLDGLPLALELAAGRVPLLGLQHVVALLGEEVSALIGTQRSAPIRQRSVEATVEWSYALLDESERRLLLRLAVFAGSWSLVGAEAACSDDQLPRATILHVLERLIAKSLVFTEPAGEHKRYRLLHTVRGFLLARLTAAGTLGTWRDRHLAWSIELAGLAQSRVFAPPMLDWLERELDNIRVALTHAIDSGQTAAGLDLCTRLTLFWLQRGHLAEAATALARLRKQVTPAVAAELVARAHILSGSLAVAFGDTAVALAELEAGLALARTRGMDRTAAQAHFFLGEAHFELGNLEPARLAMQAAWRYYATQDSGHHPPVRARLASICLAEDDLELAWQHAQAALVWAQAHPLPVPLGRGWEVVGRCAYARHDTARALDCLRTALGHARASHVPRLVVDVALALVYLHLDRQEPAPAAALLGEVLELVKVRAWRIARIRLAEATAVLVVATQPARAARLLGVASALRAEADARRAPGEARRWTAVLSVLSRRLRLRRRDLTDAAADLDAERLLDEVATALLPFLATPRATAALSAREREVALLLADRLSNRAIAERLGLSVGTVRVHVEHILAKLGLRSRVQVGPWVREQTAAHRRTA